MQTQARLQGTGKLNNINITGNKPQIPEQILVKWESLLNLLSEMLEIPGALIIEIAEKKINSFEMNSNQANPYTKGETTSFHKERYGETVMRKDQYLEVKEAFKSIYWKDNGCFTFDMRFYESYPIKWPDRDIFGTICALNSDEINHTEKLKTILKALQMIVEQDLENLMITETLKESVQKAETLEKQAMLAKEEAEKANNAKSNFLAQMSHDLRTPITTVIGFAKFGQEEAQIPKLVDYFSQIEHASDYLLSMLNDVLDSQKIDNNAITIVKKATDLSQVYKNIANIIHSKIQSKEIYFTTNIDPTAPQKFLVKTDAKRLSQILINLLTNAIKYTPKRGKIVFQEKRLKETENTICIEYLIKDNGVGMSKAFQSIMYQPFTKEKNAFSYQEGGTGLGLSISHSLVKKMHATMRCTSQLNEGTTFILTFTFEKTRRPMNLTKIETKGGYDYSQVHVLIAEDSPINAKIISRILEKMAMDTTIVNNGLEAVQQNQKKHYDLIIMDINMPVMNGLEATQKIRERDRRIPIIALSANAYQDDIDRATAVGVNAYLAKPINNQKLRQNIAQLVS